MSLPLLQSHDWEKLQVALGAETIFVETDDYTFLGIIKRSRLGNYLYLPYGPYLRNKNSAKACYQALESLSQSKNLVFVRIEPQNAENAEFLLKMPRSIKTKDLNPKDTWILDLTPEKSELLTGFSQGTRTRYNQFAKKGLSVEVSRNPEDIHYLVDLQHKLAHQKKIGTFSEKYLKTELAQDFATLYLVHYDENIQNLNNSEQNPAPAQLSNNQNSKIIAASLFFDFGDTRFYMQSAADMEYKKLPGTVALLSTAIFDAKAKGLKKFDFWGIAPENAPKDHPWAGFTAFKKSFGGYPVSYAGTYDLVFKPTKYRLYNLARKTNRTLRKIAH